MLEKLSFLQTLSFISPGGKNSYLKTVTLPTQTEQGLAKVTPLKKFVQALSECGALVRLSFDLTGYIYNVTNGSNACFINSLVKALDLCCEIETKKAIAELGASARVLPYLRKANSL